MVRGSLKVSWGSGKKLSHNIVKLSLFIRVCWSGCTGLEAVDAHSTLETSKFDNVSKLIWIYLKYARGARVFYQAIAFQHELTFYAYLDVLFVLLDTHIVHKDILFLHELPFYVDLDLLFALLDTHIVHKDILLLHELTFYVDLDFLFVLIDTHIVHKDNSFHHELTFYAYLECLLLLLDTGDSF